MKKTLFLFVGACVLYLTSVAQSEAYYGKMRETLAWMDSARTTSEMQEVSAQFERIGDAEQGQWLPYYYAALSQLNIGWRDQKADKDKLADKVKSLLTKAEAIQKNTELYLLRYMVATQQMLVDPASRWMTYSSVMDAALANAKKADPNNPRIYYLEGSGVFGKPEAFGGGKSNAKPLFEKAVNLFRNFKPESPLHPKWGQQQAEEMLVKCSS